MRTEYIMRVLGGKAERHRAGREPWNAHSQLFALIPIPASSRNKDRCRIYSGLYIDSFL